MVKQTPFLEWFNPNDGDQAKALVHYLEHGEWPQHFLPADVEFDNNGTSGDIFAALKCVAVAWSSHFARPYRSSNIQSGVQRIVWTDSN